MILARKKLYDLPSNTDRTFQGIINGNFRKLPQHVDFLNCLPADAVDVMERIFKPANKRITMEELLQHRFLKVTSDVPVFEPSMGREGI